MTIKYTTVQIPVELLSDCIQLANWLESVAECPQKAHPANLSLYKDQAILVRSWLQEYVLPQIAVEGEQP